MLFHFKDNQILLNEDEFPFPISVEEITKLLGKKQRHIMHDPYEHSLIWDDLGICIWAINPKRIDRLA